MNPVVITASISGNKTLKDSPYIPVSLDLAIEDGIKSYRAGASQLHIHGRNRDGQASQDPNVCKEILDAFRVECPDVVLQLSAWDTYHDPEGLLRPLLALKPHIASLSLQDSREANVSLVRLFDEYGVLPIIEVGTPDDAQRICDLLQEGVLHLPMHVEIGMGENKENRDFSELARELMMCKQLFDPIEGITWSVCGGGQSVPALHALTGALGGNIRTGLEDCTRFPNGEYIIKSADIVSIAVDLCRMIGRPVATPSDARRVLSIR